ncbi:MAG TPA: hypothetical protein VKH63_18850 [Candidatus Acidoferrum sp.]|jgi:hypothetical protein|nr:hypothetical protein [Candidatus Acidoferrum sp.]
MEWLAVSALVDEDFPERVFYLCPTDSKENLGEKITLSNADFGLFVAMNANGVADERILQGAKLLLSKGLACLCTWGPDCERVHDRFDVAARGINSELSGDDVIMTTWHADETIEEALWFFVHAALVTKKFDKTCKDWIIAPISSPELEQLIRSKIGEINIITKD